MWNKILLYFDLLVLKEGDRVIGNETNMKMLKNIARNYKKMEESIVNQLFFKCEHGSSIGGFREEIWKDLFSTIIPKKFSIERSVFIIDSQQNVSNEVDLVIFDEQYTPYIFKYGTLKFIPIEAVAVVIECKSSAPDKQIINNWSKSIDNLRTSNKSIARMATQIVIDEQNIFDDKGKIKVTQSATRPIKILCCLERNTQVEHNFDFIIKADNNESKLEVICNYDKKLSWWHKELNHNNSNYEVNNNWIGRDSQLKEYTIKDKDENENTILTLIFKLNQLLMLINNPMLFPHKAYVDMFNEVLKD